MFKPWQEGLLDVDLAFTRVRFQAGRACDVKPTSQKLMGTKILLSQCLSVCLPRLQDMDGRA
jgi:hypothetical protein